MSEPQLASDETIVEEDVVELDPTVEPERQPNKRRSIIVSIVLLLISLGTLATFPLSVNLPGMALALIFVAVFAEITSVQFDGKLTVSGWDCCCLLAIGFCSPWVGAALIVIAMGAGYVVENYRAEALFGNITAMVFSSTMGAVLFRLIDASMDQYSLFAFAIGVLSVGVMGIHVLTISLVFGIMDGFSFGQMLVRLRSVMPLVIFQAAFGVSVACLVLRYSPEAGVFFAFIVATCNYMAHLIVSERESDRQAEGLRQLAYQDALTQLPARRSWDEEYPKLLHRNSVAVAFIDCNSFKGINDTYGHETGDLVLIALAERLQGAIRAEDLAARFAGDEFVTAVHLNTIDEQRARDYAEQAIRRLEDAINGPVAVSDELSLDLTISIGYAIYPFDSEDASELEHLADESMYEHKALVKGDTSR